MKFIMANKGLEVGVYKNFRVYVAEEIVKEGDEIILETVKGSGLEGLSINLFFELNNKNIKKVIFYRADKIGQGSSVSPFELKNIVEKMKEKAKFSKYNLILKIEKEVKNL